MELGVPLTVDLYSLRGLLFCAGCQQPLHSLQGAGGCRAYRSLCGCRLTSVDAETVERLVVAAVARENPGVTVELPATDQAAVFRRLLAEVRVGGTADELTFIWRT